MLSNIEIQMTLDVIRNQYAVGESIVGIISNMADQAIAANVLAEQNKLLKIENDRLRTKLLSMGISQL